MASTTTHYFFGSEVIKRLDPTLQQILTNHKAYFIFGQQGPDFFFYHVFHVANKRKFAAGRYIHKQPMLDLYLRNQKELKSRPLTDPLWAYYLGVLCHFALDISFHTVIAEIEGRLPLSHLEMEREFDRALLIDHGLDPRTFLTRNVIPHPDLISDVVYEFYRTYPQITLSTVKDSIYYFRIIEMLLHINSPGKERRVKLLMKNTGFYSKFKGKLLPLEPRKGADVSNSILAQAYDSALPLALEFMEWATDPASSDVPDSFYLNFDGKKLC